MYVPLYNAINARTYLSSSSCLKFKNGIIGLNCMVDGQKVMKT